MHRDSRSGRTMGATTMIAAALTAITMTHAAAHPRTPRPAYHLQAALEVDDEPLIAEPIRLNVDLSGQFMHGDIDGVVQVPKGGRTGTSSPDRPTLDELGFDDVSIVDVSASLQWERHIFDSGGRFVRLDGSATLRTDLITHAVTFPARTLVSADLQFDWYRLGYRYEFLFDPDEHGNRLSFAPGIDVVLFDFDYELRGGGDFHANRDYLKAGVRVGGVGRWLTSGPISIEGSAFWGLPFDGTAQIFSLELVGKYRLWGGKSATSGSLYLGVAYDEIEYEDDQGFPNRVDVDMGPLFIAGMKITF